LSAAASGLLKEPLCGFVYRVRAQINSLENYFQLEMNGTLAAEFI
jgi:hypothetical protein